eukprot:6100963-Prorocentrum_lima.AAC.1
MSKSFALLRAPTLNRRGRTSALVLRKGLARVLQFGAGCARIGWYILLTNRHKLLLAIEEEVG